jgi:hypothetical protein
MREMELAVASAGRSRVDATAVDPELPVEIIGGLPIAVIDRARSAQLMIDIAAAAASIARRRTHRPGVRHRLRGVPLTAIAAARKLRLTPQHDVGLPLRHGRVRRPVSI